MSVSLFGPLPTREEVAGREGQGLLERLQVTADGRELGPGGFFRVVDGRRGSEAFEALQENVRGRRRIQDPAVEKYIMAAVGDFAARGKFHHGNTREHNPTQRAFAA